MALVLRAHAQYHPVIPLTPEEKAVRAHLQTLVQDQQSDMIHHRINALTRLYLTGDSAQEALKVSQVRSQYLFNWARLRHIEWVGIAVTVRTPSIQIVSPTMVRFYAVERERYTYRYQGRKKSPVVFGIASRHYLSIMEDHGQWKFQSDDFTNPVLPDDMAGQRTPLQTGGHPPQGPWSQGRMDAVRYANTFCGNAPGCGNDGRYNRDYQNYNGNGGDCTNFISQVLHAGGWRMTPVWNYDHTADEGSAAWTNASALAQFLADSGRATLYAHGSYATVTRPTAKSPEGAIESLRPGDLISYQEHGRIVHSAVVVGYDPKGVPLTIAHTNDRYHVPWDFGWSDRTVFYLWHIHYPGEVKSEERTR